jgi:hypothetical protein
MKESKSTALLGNCIALAIAFAAALQNACSAQTAMQGKWADANDPVAMQLIEQERKWAVLDCAPSNVIAESLAEDFVGTSPAGPIYNKADLLKEHGAPLPTRDCKLLSARVRFYGANLAMIYGSETSIHKGPDGKEFDQSLIWTDTWLKRDGKWKIIAVQDMFAPKP